MQRESSEINVLHNGADDTIGSKQKMYKFSWL